MFRLRAALVLVSVLGAAGFGCRAQEKNEGLIVFAIEIAPAVRPIDKLLIAAPGVERASAHEVSGATLAVEHIQFGYYLPATASSFSVEVTAVRGTCVVGKGTLVVPRLDAGQRRDSMTAVAVTAVPAPCADAGVAAAGDAGIAEAGADVAVPDETPPVLMTSLPADGAKDVDRGAPIVLRFSEPLAAASITADTVTVTADARRVEGQVGLDDAGTAVTFRPAKRLPRLAKVVATAGTGVRDLGGQPLAAAATTSFVTADGTWSTPEQIAMNDNSELELTATLELVAAPSGDAIVLWEKHLRGTMAGADATSVLQSYRLVPGQGWSASDLLGAEKYAGQHRLSIAMNDEGRALAVLDERRVIPAEPGRPERIVSTIDHAAYDPAKGWSKHLRLEQELEDSGAPHVAMSRAGDAFAVWSWTANRATSDHRIVALRYTGGFWGIQKQFISQPPQAMPPTVSNWPALTAVDPKGNAVAVWIHKAGGNDGPSELWGNRFDPLTGWGTAVRIAPTGTNNPWGPRVVIDDAGNAVAAWAQTAPDRNSDLVYFVTFRVATGKWSPPVFAGMSFINSPELAVNRDGTAAIAFGTLRDGTLINIVDGAIVKTTRLTGSTWLLTPGIDQHGHQLLLWLAPDSVTMAPTKTPVYAARLRAEEDLQPPVKLNTAEASGMAKLHVLPDGSARAVWVEGTKPHRLMTAAFD